MAVTRAAQCSWRTTRKSSKAAQQHEAEMTMGALELEVLYGVEWRPSFQWVGWAVRRKDDDAGYYYYYSKDPCWPNHRRRCVDGPWLARMMMQHELVVEDLVVLPGVNWTVFPQTESLERLQQTQGKRVVSVNTSTYTL
jgi:hypothetical protein